MDKDRWVVADLAAQLQQHWATYHHHKEQMAFTAAVLYSTAAISLGVARPEGLSKLPRVLAIGGFSIIAICSFLFVCWQFRNRSKARENANGMMAVIRKCVAGDKGEEEEEPTKKGWKFSEIFWGHRASAAFTYAVMAAATVIGLYGLLS